MKHHVIWDAPLSSSGRRTLRSLIAGTTRIEVRQEEPVNWQASTIYVGSDVPGELAAAGALRHLINPWAGVTPEQIQFVRDNPEVQLHNTHYNAEFVSQHIMALLLAGLARLAGADAKLREGDWTPRYDDSWRFLNLAGAECLILGYGAIGQALARRLAAFGARINVIKRTLDDGQRKSSGISHIYLLPELEAALQTADVVISTLPFTEHTDRLLGETAFATFKHSSYFVNVGRGGVVDQHALYQALRSGHLSGAALDVWWNYPESVPQRTATQPADAPLWKLPNVILSPHRANMVHDEEFARVSDLVNEIAAIARGEKRNVVDVEAGY